MSMLSRRLQVLIAPEQYDRLRREARRRETSVGDVVRQAIDREVTDHVEQRRLAWERLTALGPFPVPADPDELEAELDAMFEESASE
jgi:hypothetical protein